MPMNKYIPRTIAIFFVLGLAFSCRQAETREPIHPAIQAVERPTDEGDCGIEDGTQSATVDYYNPTTGHRATYSLDVEVENCQVIQINFSNGGYLDSDHIDPADIDDNGDASVEDDRGRRFEVHLKQ